MSLSSLSLDAFLAVSKAQSFSKAAKNLSLTQSALSQRVLNLESEIGATLFLRESSGIRLTEVGEKLLRYCQSRELLENEFLAELRSNTSGQINGILKIAGFSTINRSILLPIVSDIAHEHPSIQIELISEEIRNLSSLLTTGKVDFVFTTHPNVKPGFECLKIGYEENVLIQPTLKKWRKDVFLDHDMEDMTSIEFFRSQGKKAASLHRNYLGDIYSILDGVRLGLGQAVVPVHLAEQTKGIEIVTGYKPLRIPIYLIFHSQAFYTNLQKFVIQRLLKESSEKLKILSKN